MAANGLNYNSSNELRFTTNTVTREIIDSSGNHGFGVLTPTNLVDISGSTSTPLKIRGLSDETAKQRVLVTDTDGVVSYRDDLLAASGISYDSSWGITVEDTAGSTSASFELPFITGGSYNAGTDTLTLGINGNLESAITISGFEDADTFVTGGTLSQAAGTVTLEYTDGDFGPVTLTGAFDFVTGGTLANNQITLEKNVGSNDVLGTVVAFTAFTQTGNDVQFDGSNVSSDTFEINAITGATFSLATGNISWAGSNTYDATLSLGTDFVTGVTEANNVISVTKNGGATVTSTIQAITGASYDNDWGIDVSGTGTITSDFELPFITGGSYNAGTDTLTLVINGGLESDITISGFEGADTFVTGGTLTQAGGTIALGRNDNVTVNLSGAFTFVTGASYSAGSLTLTLNDNSTDVVSGLEFTLSDGSNTQTVQLGDTLVVAGGSGLTSTVTATDTVTLNIGQGAGIVVGADDISHYNSGAAPSDIASDNSNGVVIQDVAFNFDTFGHVTGATVGTVDLDNRYYAFTTIGVPEGANVEADAYNDTLTFVSNDGSVRISGNSTSDTINFEVIESAIDIFILDADSGTPETVNGGDTVTIAGGVGLSTVVGATDTVTINIDNTGVSAGNYGSSSEVPVFDVNAQGQITGVTNTTIDGSAIDNNTITFDGTTGSNPAVALNGTLTLISSDNSVVISGGTGTLDITVDDTNIDNIYTADGTLTGNRVVTQNNNSLSFTGGDFSVDGTTFNVDDSANAVGVGVSTPAASAVLEVASTTKGFLFPRMTETQRGNIGSPATGLMVYQTDGDEGVYIYKSFGWVQVI
jgi:hypothetical protein